MIQGSDYKTQLAVVREYAMPGVEDWMSISVRNADVGFAAPPLPSSLRRLEWEADQMRARAERFPGVGFSVWAEFVSRMRTGLAAEGLKP